MHRVLKRARRALLATAALLAAGPAAYLAAVPAAYLAAAPAARAEAPLRSDIPVSRPGAAGRPASAAAAAAVAATDADAFAPAETHVAEAKLSGTVGYALVDLEQGRVVEARAATRGFPPASVTKLVTALYALETLGPDHRFETRLTASGALRDGVLNGPLALVGGGDPELDTDALAEMAAQARQRGLRRVAGPFVVDALALPAIARIDPGQPEHVAYNPAVSALNLNFNRVLFSWQGTGAGRRLSMEARARGRSPEVSAISVALAPGGSPVFSRRDMTGGQGPQEAWRVASDALNRKGQRWLPVRRPDIYAGDALRAVAREAGLELPPPEAGRAPDGAATLALRRSAPLREIVRSMLRHSTNLTAEVIGLAASAARGADPADLRASGLAMTRWAEARAGLGNGSGLALVNHSGLAPGSRASPLQLTAILRAAALRAPGPLSRTRRAAVASSAAIPTLGVVTARDAQAGAGGVGLVALERTPRAPAPAAPAAAAPPGPSGRGDPGLLGEILREVRLDARKGEPELPGPAAAVAKTGTLLYVRGLAGYLTAASGRRYAFAIFSEDLDARARMTDHGAADRRARSWLGRAKRMERRILRSWAARR